MVQHGKIIKAFRLPREPSDNTARKSNHANRRSFQQLTLSLFSPENELMSLADRTGNIDPSQHGPRAVCQFVKVVLCIIYIKRDVIRRISASPSPRSSVPIQTNDPICSTYRTMTSSIPRLFNYRFYAVNLPTRHRMTMGTTQ